MPASLYPNPASLSLGNLDLIMMNEQNYENVQDSRSAAEQIALQLALLQQQEPGPNQSNGVHTSSASIQNGIHQNGSHGMPSHEHNLLNGHGASGSLEDLKNTQRRSQNMTECVPVPSSEHVAEIVGRQGCKIKALRAKTNTYIKTPVRGEEPVFVVTGRKEDVACAKREILSAADHFSQIRASRKSNINSTLAFGQLMANTPGQTTVQVRVPYRVVGLVVGPKGATIKRIQQQTHTYIVTPSRDKEPVFEVTGLPENVEAARKEIEAHIAIRTGTTDFNSGGPSGSGTGQNGTQNGGNGGNSPYFNLNDNNDLFSTSGGLNSPFSSSSSNLDHVSSILNSDSNCFASFKNSSGITLANLLSSSSNSGGSNNGGNSSNAGSGNHHQESNGSNNFGEIGSSRNIAWSNGTDSHDSGIGHSPPFDSNNMGQNQGFKGFMPNNDPAMTGIWGELNKVLGGLDLNNDSNGYENGHGTSKNNGHGSSSALNGGNNGFLSIGSRSSLDLGTLGRSEQQNGSGPGLSSTSPSSSSSMINTANMGRQLSLPTETSNPSNSLPAFGGLNGVASNAEAGTSTPPSDLTKDEQSTTSEAVA